MFEFTFFSKFRQNICRRLTMYYFMYDDHNSRNEAIYNENEIEKEICENCGGIHTSVKGIYNFSIKGKLCDCYDVGSDFVISEKFLNILRENGYTGFEVSETAPVKSTNISCGIPIEEKYFLLKVTGRCGLLRKLDGELFPYCRKCHRKIGSTGLVTTGVTFAELEYDGSDIFAFENLSNIPIVSEEIKDVLLKSKLTNLRFVALNEWEYFDRILERSVRRRLEKGSIFPELIESWLKYGVLTEQELNDQLNKND